MKFAGKPFELIRWQAITVGSRPIMVPTYGIT
jgi:hypothetical protein